MGKSNKKNKQASVGRPVKSKATIEPIAPATWARVRSLVERGAIEAIHGSQLGELSYHGKVNATQASAGFRVAEIYGRYERLIVGTKRSAASPSYETGYGSGGSIDEFEHLTLLDREGNTINDPKCQCILCTTRNGWIKLQKFLDDFPHQARSQIEALCVNDERINPALLPDLVTMLDHLAGFFGIVSAGKNRPAPLRRLKRELETTTAPAPSIPRVNVEAKCFSLVLARICPKLKADQLHTAYETFVTLKDRERFRDAKARGQFTSRKP